MVYGRRGWRWLRNSCIKALEDLSSVSQAASPCSRFLRWQFFPHFRLLLPRMQHLLLGKLPLPLLLLPLLPLPLPLLLLLLLPSLLSGLLPLPQ